MDNKFKESKNWWTERSGTDLKIPIGICDEGEYQLEFNNDTNVHCVITGVAGAGKSCLLHSLITRACMNYSPNELRLFLIDLKSGVEFQNYAVQYLPHADFIALQSNPKYALHLLAIIEKRINERAVKFMENGVNVKSFAEYRVKVPGEIMPRYLIIIDEYQQLFLNFDDRSRALGHLEYIAMQGRSFGFNLVMASQFTALSSEMMENFGLKILMKVRNQIAASDLLGANIDSSYKAKAELLKPGQAFIPEETNVIKIQSYFLGEDEHLKYLKSIKAKWDNFEGNKFEQSLIVFSSEEPALINRNKTIKALSGKKTTDLVFSPGEKVMVDGVDFICQLKREKNGNILFLGGESDVSLRAVHGTFISLLPQLSPKNAQIEIFNFVPKREKQFYESIKSSADIIKSYFQHANYFEDGLDIKQKLVEYKVDLDDRIQ
ncbi:MAG TPA: FtsK/SpoIIIE domain-containing protein, partial [Saprospiraceae bacterium]|nr:FtsK/SpoIIIE domain-containing protein [Saprospiraceae bacterium]